jgi:hypothetical protein
MHTDFDIIAANGSPGNGDEDGTGLGLATNTPTTTKNPTPHKLQNLNQD